jgi:serine/threonine protein kinase
MPQFQSEEPKSQRSVLQILGQKSGLASKVLLPDSDSEHGGSPVVAPGSAAKLVPQGRGNYQLLGEIARGGMGVILKGHDTDLGRDVAVKVLDSKLAKRPEVVQRFIEEAQIGGQLQHHGIVPVYELGLMADESPYFTMKLIKGRTLAALFQQRKNPADNRGRLLAIFESVCQTMAYAHSKGVLHRDLKPANVMVGAFGEVQVVDWGLAKVLKTGGVHDEQRSRVRDGRQQREAAGAAVHQLGARRQRDVSAVGEPSDLVDDADADAFVPQEDVADAEHEEGSVRAAHSMSFRTSGPPSRASTISSGVTYL